MNSVPRCCICDSQDADYITGTKPWGKSWHCRTCDFVYDGSVSEREAADTKSQRYRYRATRDAQKRLGGRPDAQRQRGVEAVKGMRAALAAFDESEKR